MPRGPRPTTGSTAAHHTTAPLAGGEVVVAVRATDPLGPRGDTSNRTSHTTWYRPRHEVIVAPGHCWDTTGGSSAARCRRHMPIDRLLVSPPTSVPGGRRQHPAAGRTCRAGRSQQLRPIGPRLAATQGADIIPARTTRRQGARNAEHPAWPTATRRGPGGTGFPRSPGRHLRTRARTKAATAARHTAPTSRQDRPRSNPTSRPTACCWGPGHGWSSRAGHGGEAPPERQGTSRSFGSATPQRRPLAGWHGATGRREATFRPPRLL